MGNMSANSKKTQNIAQQFNPDCRASSKLIDAVDRKGRFRLGRKPITKRVSRAIRRIAEILRKRWHHDIWEVGEWLGDVYRGWLNYYGVPGSSRLKRIFSIGVPESSS